ncbi:MAG: DUF1634 domain-containing protein [Chloroflexota bacterium]
MTPDRFRAVVSGVLIGGVVSSAALIALGFTASLAVGWDGSLRGLAATTRSASDFSAIGIGLRDLRPIAFAQAGLLVLVATPVVRVAASFVAFVLERDRLYAAITLGVLAVLLVSLFVLR